MAYASASVELDNGPRFPNFFRTHPSDAEFTPVFLTAVKQYGWKRVAIFTQDEGLFTGVILTISLYTIDCISALYMPLIKKHLFSKLGVSGQETMTFKVLLTS